MKYQKQKLGIKIPFILVKRKFYLLLQQQQQQQKVHRNKFNKGGKRPVLREL